MVTKHRADPRVLCGCFTLLITDCLITVTDSSWLVGVGGLGQEIRVRRYGGTVNAGHPAPPSRSRTGAKVRKKSLISDIDPLATAFPPNNKTSRNKGGKSTSSDSYFPSITSLFRLLKYLVIREKQQYCVSIKPQI